MNSIFDKLVRRTGAYSLPYLIYLYDENKNFELRFVNNTSDVTFEGNLYKAGSFSYQPSESSDGFAPGGNLEIAIKDNQVADLIISYTRIKLEVIGSINSEGYITEIKAFKHNYGICTGDRTKIKVTFDKDDRSEMTFPTLIWNNINNRGNSN